MVTTFFFGFTGGQYRKVAVGNAIGLIVIGFGALVAGGVEAAFATCCNDIGRDLHGIQLGRRVRVGWVISFWLGAFWLGAG